MTSNWGLFWIFNIWHCCVLYNTFMLKKGGALGVEQKSYAHLLNKLVLAWSFIPYRISKMKAQASPPRVQSSRALNWQDLKHKGSNEAVAHKLSSCLTQLPLPVLQWLLSNQTTASSNVPVGQVSGTNPKATAFIHKLLQKKPQFLKTEQIRKFYYTLPCSQVLLSQLFQRESMQPSSSALSSVWSWAPAYYERYLVLVIITADESVQGLLDHQLFN